VSALRRADADVLWAALCFGGGVLFVVALTIATGLAVFIGNVAGDLEPPALEALHEANLLVVYPWTVGACAFLLGAGAGVLQSEPLPRWLGWMALFSESWLRFRTTSSAARSTTSGLSPSPGSASGHSS
jgi:hypothetical protein